ncbi:MAG: single-stranded DNA-binding protein [Puniceicoccales bacterium]|jgi:single-strand DNA-binding protein|nr:single-stranded DNA-binding protein [Puniceicoccales bacterium]
MASFNRVILMGNMTRDPELRTTEAGMAITKFGLAMSRSFKSQNGESHEETTFVDVDSFGRQAEVIAKFFSKGKPILVEGRLRLDQWESPSGERRNRLVVVLENFQFVGTRGEEAAVQENAPLEARASSSFNPLSAAREKLGGDRELKVPAPSQDLDDDIPF